MLGSNTRNCSTGGGSLLFQTEHLALFEMIVKLSNRQGT